MISMIRWLDGIADSDMNLSKVRELVWELPGKPGMLQSMGVAKN